MRPRIASAKIAKHIRTHVVGYIALFVALSGTAVALPGSGSVDHDDLSRHVVHRSKIHANAVNSARVAEDSLRGIDIDEGTLDLNLLRVDDVSDFDSESPKQAVARCPDDSSVVGTGADIVGGKVGSFPDEYSKVVFDPILPSGSLVSVTVQAYETDGGTSANWDVRAIAICAKVAD